MPSTFQEADRLLTQHVSPEQVGGFLTWDAHTRTETLFAVDPDTRQAVSRTDRIGCKEFDRDGWTKCDSVPENAEWIGNYPAPKARAALKAYASGTRIKLTGAVGGFQD